jgi:hypothetical protein
MRARHRAAVLLVTAATGLGAGWLMPHQLGQARPDPGVSMPFEDGFADLPADVPWRDGEVHGQWQARFDGWGTTRVTESGTLSQRPRPAARVDRTDASLVTTTRDFGDLDATALVRTTRQLRDPAPNPWETAWLIWHYTDNQHFYYLVLKPNGWELGKEDPAYPGAQRFLATGASPRFPVGAWHTARVQQTGDRITVWGNGQLLTTIRDEQRPYRHGRLGLYNEDAAVEFRDVRVSTR